MPRSGGPSLARLRRTVGVALLALASGGCLYGFAGGGLPPHVKTVAVLPFENETALPELQGEIADALRGTFASRLGVREAAESRANAVVRGTITAFDPDAPVAFSADPSRQNNAVRRRLTVTVDVEVVDQVTGRTLWQRKGITAEGEYSEGGERQGRRQAIERIVNDILEGVQSQW